MANSDEGVVVTVTAGREITIPQAFRERLRVEGGGRIRFSETEEGAITLQRVKRPSEIQGELSSETAQDEESAVKLLQEDRERDKQEDEGHFQSKKDIDSQRHCVNSPSASFVREADWVSSSAEVSIPPDERYTSGKTRRITHRKGGTATGLTFDWVSDTPAVLGG